MVLVLHRGSIVAKAPMAQNGHYFLSTRNCPTLYLYHSQAPEMPDLARLAQLAKEHPWIDVRYEFSNFNFDMHDEYPTFNFLSTGIVLVATFKGEVEGKLVKDALFGTSPAWPTLLLGIAANWRKKLNIESLIKDVKNFRLVPTADNPWDEEVVWQKEMKADAKKININENLKKAWLHYGALWMAEGIKLD